MITKLAEDYLEKEAFFGALAKGIGGKALNFGKSLGQKAGNFTNSLGEGVKAIPKIKNNLGSIVNIGRTSYNNSRAGGIGMRASVKEALPTMSQRITDAAGTRGVQGLKDIKNTVKYTAGIGGGAYVGNKIYNLGKQPPKPDPRVQQYYR